MAKRLLFTKYSHWKYEEEVRSFVTLDTADQDSGLYFAEFSDMLRLTTVIVGVRSLVSQSEVRQALGNLAPSVEAFKARVAFKSFRVVRQRNPKLWHKKLPATPL